MSTFPITNRKFLAASILAISFVLSLALIHAEAASNDSSIKIEKDPFSGKFTLTMKDPDGIQEFSLSLVGRYSYGGGLSSCPKSFSSNNVSLMDPSDFTPVMPAYIIDCKNNKTELEIPPPVEGVTKSVLVKKEEAPPPAPPPVEKKEEKKGPAPSAVEGPLSKEDIQYPVSGLGSCQNETECRSYCDNADHAKECFAFAKKYHLISEEEAQKAADHFLNVKNGPGGCNSGKSCEAYCSTVEHIDECITFAEETGYYKPEELAEAKKFQALVKAGTKFPGGCTERNACEIYCGDPNHMEECLNFAEKSGFMPPEEIAEAKKFMALMQKGESPGGCTSKEQCEKYCFEENHIDECIAFAEKAGVMSAEDAQMARKVGGKGPGNCRSKEQCDAYCQDHSEECFNFAKEHGLINEDELKQMREGMARFREELDKMPPEAVQCMKDAAGEDNFNKMIAGEPVFDRSIETRMKSCFGQVTAQFSQQLSQLPPEAAQCIKDAVGDEGLQKLQSGEFDEHVNFESLEECFQQLKASFGEGSNFGAGGFSGPGGCKNMEECTAYCQEHLDECQGFGPPHGDSRAHPGCSFMDFDPVCVKIKDSESSNITKTVTYNNECFAKNHEGRGILLEVTHGTCVGHQSCDPVPSPVCGIKGGITQSYFNTCVAEGDNIPDAPKILHEGECTKEEETLMGDGARLPDGQGFSGPGGCTSKEECVMYCTKNYQDPACQKFIPPTSSTPSQDYQQEYQQPTNGSYGGFGDFNIPPEVSSCVGEEMMERVKRGEASPDELRAKITACFQNVQSQPSSSPYPTGGSFPDTSSTPSSDYQQPYQQTQPSETYTGPGGCTSKEECTAYCTKNYTDPACQQFLPPTTSGSLLSSPLVNAVLGPWLLLFK